MRIQSSTMAMPVMPVQKVDNVTSPDFVSEISQEMADEVANTGTDLKPGETKDFSYILESQTALGNRRRDMFLTVGATEKAEKLFFNKNKQD